MIQRVEICSSLLIIPISSNHLQIYYSNLKQLRKQASAPELQHPAELPEASLSKALPNED